MVQDLTVSQSLIRSFPASLWNIEYILMNGCVEQRVRERERVMLCVPTARAFPNTCT